MSDEEGNKKKMIIGGSIIGVCILGLVYIFFIKGDPAPTQEQTAAEIRAAEIQKAAEAEAGQVFAGARTESARDAVGAITEKAAQDAASEDLSRKNRDEILAQPGASVVVSPDVAAAGRRAICLRDSARCRPECVRLLGPCSAGARSRGSGA